jgi:hypothetical protein
MVQKSMGMEDFAEKMRRKRNGGVYVLTEMNQQAERRDQFAGVYFDQVVDVTYDRTPPRKINDPPATLESRPEKKD